MAGKVAKYGSLSMSFGAGKSNSDYKDDSRTGNGTGKKSIKNRSGHIMDDFILIEEDAVIKSLGIEVEREKALQYLDRQFRENNSLLIFQNKTSLFQGFAQALCGNDINVRIECTKLIAKVIPQLGPDMEQCMNCVLPKIVSNIGNITALQKESIQTLHICMKHAADVYQILKVIAKNGIKHTDRKTRKQIIHTFPTLLFQEFKNEDFFDIVIALVENLNEADSDSHKVLKTLSHVKKFVGIQRFKSYIHDLPSPLQSLYEEMVLMADTSTVTSSRSTPSLLLETLPNGDMPYQSIINPPGFDRTSFDNVTVRGAPDFSKSGYFDSSSMKNSLGKGFKVRPNYITPARSPDMPQQLSPHYEFGFIAKSIIENLSSNDNKARSRAVDELKNTITNMKDITPLRQNIIPLISLLHPVVEDNNYRVSCGALQTLGLVVQRLGHEIKPYAKMICTTASKRIGSKDAIRSECMKLLLTLEEVTDPNTVLEQFYDKLQHKQAKIREETINLIIATLLHFPSHENINFSRLISQFVPVLLDSKPKVRFVAFECLALLDYYYNQEGRDIQEIFEVVNNQELIDSNANGLMSAVLDRLFRKKCPKLRENMLVEYSMPSSCLVYSTEKGNADVNFILAASNTPKSQSSLSHFSSSANSSFISSADTYPVNMNSSIPDPHRRHPSAGKRGVFPWANENSEKHPSSAPSQSQRNNLGESHPPLRPRATWGPESQEKPSGQAPVRTRVNRPSDSGAGSGGYLGIHQRKQANAVNKEPLNNVGLPVRQRKQVDGESTHLHSAPTMGRNSSVTDAGGYQPSFMSNEVTARQPRANMGPLKAQNNDPLSNSCPTTFFDENNQVKLYKSRRVPVLAESGLQRSLEDIMDDPGTPIHTRPQLARSARSQRRESPKQENQQSPVKWNKTASPRLDRIVDNPTVENVRPIIKTRNQTDNKLGSNLYSDILDSPVIKPGGYTPSGLQNKANQGSNGQIPMAVIRNPTHQMKSSGSNAPMQAKNDSLFSDNDKMKSPSHRKDLSPEKFTFPASNKDSETKLKSQNRKESHAPLRNSKSLSNENFTSDFPPVSHPLLVGKASQPVPAFTPRTAPNSGARDEDIPSKAAMESIRSSAQKKRMQRTLSGAPSTTDLDASLNSTLSGSTSGRATAPESVSNSSSSGILSPTGNNSKSDNDANPVIRRPSLARPGSGRTNGSAYSPTSKTETFRYNPNSGVSINTSNKIKSNVSVVGHSYVLHPVSASANETPNSMSPATTPTNSSSSISVGLSNVKISSQSSKESKKSKGSSSRGVSASSLDQDDSINIQGKAIRDTSSSNYSPSSNKDESTLWATYSSETPSKQPPDAVVGQAVGHQGVSPDGSKEESVELAQSLQYSQIRRRMGNLRSHASEQDIVTLERKLNRISPTSPTNLNATAPIQPSRPRNNNSRTSPPRPASLDRRTGSTESSVLRTTTEILPCTHPERLLNEAIAGLQKKVNSEEWEELCNHIHTLRRLVTYHQDVAAGRMHEVLHLLNTNVSSLRSQVSRAAVVGLTDVYTHMKKPAIDVDIEKTTRTLLTTIGRNMGAFMQEEITKTFQYIVANVSSAKVLNALLNVAPSKNSTIREMTAQFVSLLVDKMGPGKALSGVKDVTEKIIAAAATFITDPSQPARYHGRCILQTLMTHPDFEKCIDRYLSAKQAKEMKEAVQNVRTKGVGTLGSAGVRNQGSGVRRLGSTNRMSRSGNPPERSAQNSSSRSRRSTPARPNFNDMDQEEIREMCSRLDSKDIKVVNGALSDLREKLDTHPLLVEDNIVKIMDKIKHLLATANTKLNTLGIDVMKTLIPRLGNVIAPTDVIPEVLRLLGSKHQKTATEAMKAMDLMLKHIDHISLLPHFTKCATYSPGKTKQVCIEKLAGLVTTVSAKKPQVLKNQIFPVLLALMSETHAVTVKRETTSLARALYAVMEDELLQYAEANSVKAKVLEMVQS